MKNYSGEEHVNVGSGTDLTILELAETVKRIVGFKGEIVRDTTKPDGTPRKLMDAGKLRAMGWKPQVSLEEGIGRVYAWYRAELAST
jgi:GDP-L-fucose synthase